jgi:hypothetical protein
VTSDAPLRAWPAFAARVHARLEAGAREYPGSPDRAELDLLDEVQQELEDVCGWSCVLWAKLEAIKARVAARGVPAADVSELARERRHTAELIAEVARLRAERAAARAGHAGSPLPGGAGPRSSGDETRS